MTTGETEALKKKRGVINAMIQLKKPNITGPEFSLFDKHVHLILIDFCLLDIFVLFFMFISDAL